MAIKGLIGSNPTNANLLQPTKFVFTVPNMPFTNYECQTVTLPSVSTTEAIQVAMAFADVKRHGDKLVYDPLTITLLVDEDLRQWEEAYNWLAALTAPQRFPQYAVNKGSELYRDCTLTILNNSNLPILRIHFSKAFPVSLGMIQFDTSGSPDVILVADYTLAYDYFTIDRP